MEFVLLTIGKMSDTKQCSLDSKQTIIDWLNSNLLLSSSTPDVKLHLKNIK